MGGKDHQMSFMHQDSLRILFWGTDSPYSTAVLETLFKAGIKPLAVYLPDLAAEASNSYGLLPPPPTPSTLPLLTTHLDPSTRTLAWAQQIPVFAIHDLRGKDIAAHLAAQQADLALVACFPRRIPASLLTIPPLGFINLHPSLLPDLRGPHPLFWAFRLGLTMTGVTLHRMDASFDTGNILAQTAVTLSDGISGPTADRLLAQAGAELFLHSQAKLPTPGTPQAPGGRSFGLPDTSAFKIPTTWPAQRAFNFMRGTSEWGRPYYIHTRESVWTVGTAVSYTPTGTLSKSPCFENGECLIEFNPGILRTRLWRS